MGCEFTVGPLGCRSPRKAVTDGVLHPLCPPGERISGGAVGFAGEKSSLVVLALVSGAGGAGMGARTRPRSEGKAVDVGCGTRSRKWCC